MRTCGVVQFDSVMTYVYIDEVVKFGIIFQKRHFFLHICATFSKSSSNICAMNIDIFRASIAIGRQKSRRQDFC